MMGERSSQASPAHAFVLVSIGRWYSADQAYLRPRVARLFESSAAVTDMSRSIITNREIPATLLSPSSD